MSHDVWMDHVLLWRHGDAAALDRLVREYERYARSLASRLQRVNEPREDLDQVALEALVVSLRRFDPGRSLPFPAFATPTILGALRRHYRDHGWLIRVPRRVHEFATAERAVAERLAAELGRVPTVTEVAAALSMSVDDVLAAQDAVHARDACSLDATVGDELRLSDLVGDDDPRLASADERLAVTDAIATLRPAEQALLHAYFVEERTQRDIAEDLGVSQMQVSRLLARILRRIRALAAP